MNCLFLCGLYFLMGKAEAVRLALEPQNKVLLGASWSDGGMGASVGLESRLTQLIYINLGGFGTFSDNTGNIESENQQDWIKMHHGIWVAPGWRIPHRYKEDALNWDVIFRGGFACVFTEDSYIQDLMLIDPAGLTGLDLYLHKNKMGVRSSSKVFFYNPDVSKTRTGLATYRIQSSLEFFWLWD